MRIRGIEELVAVLPPSAAESARALAGCLGDLASLRHAALAPEEVRALGELWERLSGQVASARLGVLAAMDARDDVIPKAKVGDAGAVFAHHVLGQRRGTARRDGRWAGLLRPEVGDLPAVGAAYAAGDISTAHVEVAVRAHRDLGARVREALVECQMPTLDGDRPAGARDGQDGESLAELRAALDGLSSAFTVRVRQVLVADAMLAHYARRHSVTELEVIARRIVDTLNRADPKGGHERRFLLMDQLPDGTWRARFECGPEQGLIIQRAIAAGSAPRPGKAIDQDGVQRSIADDRDLGARQIDALTDMAALFLTGNGIPLINAPGGGTSKNDPSPADPTRPTGDDAGHDAGHDRGHGAGVRADGRAEAHPDGCVDARDEESARPDQDLEEPPPGEGESVVLREPGVLYGPYPKAEVVVVAGIEHLAAAWAHRPHGPQLDLEDDFNGWLRQRFGPRLRTYEQSPNDSLPAESSPAESPPAESPPGGAPPGKDAPEHDAPADDLPAPGHRESPPGNAAGEEPGSPSTCTCQSSGGRSDGADMAWLGRALSPYGVPARIEQAGLVPADTLQLLACSATIRAALLAPNGALLDLGRSQRLASPAQKTALLARDGGCVIPGCVVPGDACDAHHVIWWENLGPTDLENLALVCGRHHTEVHQGTWEIQIRDGIPWVRPPSWIDRLRPLLRNAAHHPDNNRREDG